MDPEQKKKCSDILEHFLKMESTGERVYTRSSILWWLTKLTGAALPCYYVEPFHERVNWEEWGLYDYLQIVKEPMDLGTVRVKLGKSEYAKPSEFARDMRLIWDNCRLYNQVRILSLLRPAVLCVR